MSLQSRLTDKTKRSKRLNQPQGFALIATISILVLLTLVAVGLLSLSTVALRSSNQGSALLEARANARLALQMALGQLQTELGPDQRISAAAGLTMDESGSGQKRWTGVWNSWVGDNRFDFNNNSESDLIPDYSEHRKDSFRSWLISSPDVLKGNSDLSLPSSGGQGESVVLAGASTLGQDAVDADYVRAPMIELPSGTGNGRLAWWVADESLKANVIPGRRESVGDSLELLAELDAASGVAPELLESITERPDHDLLKKAAVSLGSFDLIPSGVGLQEQFDDITPYSYSVLADVREGGLKRDFSLLAERETVDSLPQTEENMLYRLGSDDGEGVPIHDLLAWFNLYKDKKHDGKGTILETGGDRPKMSTLAAMEFRTKPTQAYSNIQRQIVPVKLQLVVSLRMEPHRFQQNQLSLVMRFNPVITLWNPYNVPVSIPTARGARIKLQWRSIPVDLGFSWTPGSPPGSTSSIGSIASGGRDWGQEDANKADQRSMATGILEASNPVFAPGEVKVFSLTEKRSFDYGEPVDNTTMTEGYRPTAGNEFYGYHLADSREGRAAPDPKKGALQPNRTFYFGFGGIFTDETGYTGDQWSHLSEGRGFTFLMKPEVDRFLDPQYRNFAVYSRAGSDRKYPNAFNQEMFQMANFLDGQRTIDPPGPKASYYMLPYNTSDPNLRSPEGVAIAVFSYGMSAEAESLSDVRSDNSYPVFPLAAIPA